MAFAELTFRESLRDIETCLRAHSSKLYDLGIRGGVARSTLADANETRDWRIYQEFAMNLIRLARKLYANDSFAVELDKHGSTACRSGDTDGGNSSERSRVPGAARLWPATPTCSHS